VATGCYDVFRGQAQAHVRLDADGTAVLQSATHDTGTGTYTSMTQVAADSLGLAVNNVEFRLGDSAMPPAPAQGASQTMLSVGSAVQDTCDKLRQQAVKLAVILAC
jgi:xanthine dehydrogenase YagR molybdenum-binding subunit